MQLHTKPYQQSLIFYLILILGLPCYSFGQANDEVEKSRNPVPEFVMEQVVRRILKQSFKSQRRRKIKLFDRGIKVSWLPKIKNIEFQLVASNDISENNQKVYFFTEPTFSKGLFDVGFAFGEPDCEFTGTNWHFKVTKRKVLLWQNGGVGGGCAAAPSIPSI